MPILIAKIGDQRRRFFVSNDLVDAYSGCDLYTHFRLWVRNKTRGCGVSENLDDIEIEGLVDVTALTDGALEVMVEKGTDFDLLSLGCRMASMVMGKPRSSLSDDEIAAGVRHVKWMMGKDVEPPFGLKVVSVAGFEPTTS